MESPRQRATTQRLLGRGHSPSSTKRIFSDKIEHRKLLLRPSSPPTNNARTVRHEIRHARRGLRCSKFSKKSTEPQNRHGLDDLPCRHIEYGALEPLHDMWLGYVREILGDERYSAISLASAKLASAEFVGAKILVARSSCPSRVGLSGIVIKDTKFTFELVTATNQVKMIPKEGTVFRLEIPRSGAREQNPQSHSMVLVLEIRGDSLRHRPADRANRKFKTHFLADL